MATELGQLKILPFRLAGQSMGAYNSKIAARIVPSGFEHNLCKGKIMPDAIQTKTCSKCKQNKPVSEFHKDNSRPSGLRYWCKNCWNTASKAYYHNHFDRISRYAHEYGQTEAGKETRHRYIQSTRGKTVQLRGARKYQRRNPEKLKAQQAVHSAVRAGKLPRVRTLKCLYCGNQAEQRHHYLGYAPEHWFDVIPLCRVCHKMIHSPFRKVI